MVPTASAIGTLTGVKQNSTAIATTTRTIKGREFAFFDAAPGSYEATYAVDDTAPVISSVAHSVSGGGTATITWDTNEASDSRVDYGTNPNSLTASQSSPALVNSHSLQLTGLSSNTTYYYRVTSADSAANSSTAPAPPAAPSTFATPALTFTDSTVADFSAGSPGADTQVSQTSNGEVILKPTQGDEFSGGPGLPAGWASCPWTAPETCAAGTGATVSGGSLHVNGTYARTVATYGSGRSLEFVASFGGQSFEHAGFAVDLNTSANWAIFSVKSDGTFNARTNISGSSTETQLSSALLGSPHRYRIEWGASDVRYYVDGTLVATHTASFGATQMRPIASDFSAGSPEISVDWIHMSPYPGSGTFDSRVFDAGPGQSADWRALSWNASIPAGAGVAFGVRTGNTLTPDASWSAFTPIASSGGDIPGSSRYLQYRAQLTTGDQNTTPTLNDVSIAYSTAADTTPPVITSRSPAANATNVTRDTNVSVQFSEPMNPSTINGSSIRLRKQGAGSDVAANVSYSGNTATLNPDVDLDPNAVYTATVAGTVQDTSGNLLGANDSWAFTTAAQAPNAPSLSVTSPASPANANSPKVLGSAAPGSQVRIYTSSDCSGVPLASGTAADLSSPGITVSVPDNSITAFRATATDAAGNSSSCSGAITYTEDSAAPDTTIGSGPLGLTNNSTPTFGFSSSESGSSFQCRFDSAAFAPCSGPGATHTPSSALSQGTHTFEVRAADQAGNTDQTPASRSVTVDTQAPNTTITSGPSGSTNDSTPTFGFSSSESGSSFQCRFDSAAFAPCSGPGATHTPSSALSQGTHTFEVRAADQAGNTDQTPASRSVTVDTQAPNTTITSGPSGSTTNRTPTFTFTSSEPQGATFQCRLDSAAFSSCTTPITYPTLSFGGHTFRVRAIDAAGNVDSTPAVRTFTVSR